MDVLLPNMMDETQVKVHFSLMEPSKVCGVCGMCDSVREGVRASVFVLEGRGGAGERGLGYAGAAGGSRQCAPYQQRLCCGLPSCLALP